jgi:RND family efflux transporter MFP subunit
MKFSSRTRSFRFALICLFVLAGLALNGCRPTPAANGAAAPPLQLSAEDTLVLKAMALTSGPTITGSIQAERRADLRAEILALVLEVLRENGDPVRKGEALVRLDETAIRDALASAEAAQRAATLTLDQAMRQLERQQKLRGSGMTTAQLLEDAETRRNNALSELEAAKSRSVTARQQLARTIVRAPFDGIVIDRRVSAGDTAQVGKELLKVIDPASKRFEGLVSSEHVGRIEVGQSVRFRVNGHANQLFEGRVRRVNPAANPATRQIEVLVDLVDQVQPRLTGLYAEGTILTASRQGLVLPASAVVRDGDRTHVWRIAAGKLQKLAVKLDERDARSGDYPVLDGLAEGDRILRYPSLQLVDGQPVASETGKT